jgi:SAM-dependent methyltransferase
MEPTDRNLRAWEEAHRRRAETRLGPPLPDHVRARLPDLDGRHVLHLECGSGEGSAELVKLGALVTAIDRSAEAIALAHEREPAAAFVQADSQELPLEFRRGRFDVVYADEGTIASISDLDAWAHGIATALRESGVLLLADFHPLAACIDALGHVRADYLAEPWPVSSIVNGLLRAGLVIRGVEELVETAVGRREARIPDVLIVVAQKLTTQT